MERWLTFGIEMIKTTLILIGCLLFFYYGIIWLSENYKGDERLETPTSNVEQVQQAEKEVKNDEVGIGRLYSLLPSGKGVISKHPFFL